MLPSASVVVVPPLTDLVTERIYPGSPFQLYVGSSCATNAVSITSSTVAPAGTVTLAFSIHVVKLPPLSVCAVSPAPCASSPSSENVTVTSSPGACPSETLMVQTAGTIVPSSFAATR